MLDTRVVVTGAAGFIGSNLIHGLNRLGFGEILAVDDLTEGAKFANLLGARIADYLDKNEFYDLFARGSLGKIGVVFHEGACSDTMEQNGRVMMDANYRCSKMLLDACIAQGSRLIYASSASVYGASTNFAEVPANERPLNVYGFSKLLFDQMVRNRVTQSPVQIAGFRYFNVYGPREQHKGRMASVALHHFNQWRESGSVRLFGEYGGYGPGEQQRDFVFVDDVVAVNLWFLQHPDARGIFNLGTGRAQAFNDIAQATVNACRAHQGERPLALAEMVAEGLVGYIPIPEALRGKYQCRTQAELAALRDTGCDVRFADVATGVGRYVDWLSSQSG